MQRALSVPIWPSAHVPTVPRLFLDNCKFNKHNVGGAGRQTEKTAHLGLLDSEASLNVFLSLMTPSSGSRHLTNL